MTNLPSDTEQSLGLRPAAHAAIPTAIYARFAEVLGILRDHGLHGQIKFLHDDTRLPSQGKAVGNLRVVPHPQHDCRHFTAFVGHTVEPSDPTQLLRAIRLDNTDFSRSAHLTTAGQPPG